MSLIEKLKAGKRHIRKMKFPGTDIEIGIQVLNEAELQASIFETERHFKNAGIEISATTIGIYDKEQITQTLFRAIVEPSKPNQNGTYNKLFSNVDDLRALFFSQDIKDELVEVYNELQKEVSPSVHQMSEAELETIFETVKKNPDSGMNLSSFTLKQLLRFMVSRESTSPKDNGSISTS